MKRICLIAVLIMCMALPCAIAEESMPIAPNEDLWPVVVLMYDGEDDPELQNILLIVVNKTSGRSLKATIAKDLFAFESLDFRQTDSIAGALQTMQTHLQVPLEHYVCIDTKALDSLQPGEAKEKGIFDLIGIGFSLIGSAETNLSITDTVSVFKMAFAEKGNATEISLPSYVYEVQQQLHDDPEWEAIRLTLASALSELGQYASCCIEGT